MCDSYLKAAPFQLKAVEYYIFFRVQRLFEGGALTIIITLFTISAFFAGAHGLMV